MGRLKAVAKLINDADVKAGGSGDRIQLLFPWRVEPRVHFSIAKNQHEVEICEVDDDGASKPSTARRLSFDTLLIATGASELRDSTVGTAELHSVPEDHFAFVTIKGQKMRNVVMKATRGHNVDWLDWAAIEKHLPEGEILRAGLDNGCPVEDELRRRFAQFKELLVYGIGSVSKDGVYVPAAKPTGRNTRRARIITFLKLLKTLQMNGVAPPILAAFHRALRELMEQKGKDWTKDQFDGCYEMDARVKRVVFGAFLKAMMPLQDEVDLTKLLDIPNMLNVNRDGQFIVDVDTQAKFNFPRRRPGSRWAVHAAIFELAIAAVKKAAFVHEAGFPRGSGGAKKNAVIGVLGEALSSTQYETETGLVAVREAVEGWVRVLDRRFLNGPGFVAGRGIVKDEADDAVKEIATLTDAIKKWLVNEAHGYLKTILYPDLSNVRIGGRKGPQGVGSVSGDSNEVTFESLNEQRVFDRVNHLLKEREKTEKKEKKKERRKAKGKRKKAGIDPYDYAVIPRSGDGAKKRCSVADQECAFEILLHNEDKVLATIDADRRFNIRLPTDPKGHSGKSFDSEGQAAVYATNSPPSPETAGGA